VPNAHTRKIRLLRDALENLHRCITLHNIIIINSVYYVYVVNNNEIHNENDDACLPMNAACVHKILLYFIILSYSLVRENRPRSMFEPPSCIDFWFRGETFVINYYSGIGTSRVGHDE